MPLDPCVNIIKYTAIKSKVTAKHSEILTQD